ncbi:SCP2 sterol-binding domain-containing protein [Methylomonas sp. UP202]|uniref:SCP2 sterol-binding domain-containing protein n=1 Tax=Methylomonas sp. UP202 TaxID=3040943 RepID=UPI00247A1065|nr:SCP2 sterol-binding domain-containing protein [Methylomonas sp. UP202]WGS87249.1 SCP2 sterol-binding domain-containing protein [Methylomonas sp. UP202]
MKTIVENDINMLSVYEIFEYRFSSAIKRNRSKYPLLQGGWKIIIKDLPDEVWVIDLSKHEEYNKKGDADANVVISLSSQLLMDIINNAREPIEAFTQGAIQISGIKDIGLLTNFARLIFS